MHIAYEVGGRWVPAVRGASFDIERGEIVALVGESGSGKTTLAHAVGGLLPPTAVVQSGRLCVDGLDLTTADERHWQSVRGRLIGFVPQDPTVSLNPVQKVGAQIAEAAWLNRAMNRRLAWEFSVDLLDRVGIDLPRQRAEQYPHELSGGMRQRVLIAIALACGSRLIVADEPTSALDATVQRTVLDLLSELIANEDTSILLVTHDLGVAAERAADPRHEGRARR